MRHFFRALMGVALALCVDATAHAECHGRVTTPADFCWECMLPITIFGVTTASDDQLNMDPDSVDPICCYRFCTGGGHVGINVGYYEPAITVEVVREPYCMSGLGGTSANNTSGGEYGDYSTKNVTPEQRAGWTGQYATDGKVTSSFYQAHWLPSIAGMAVVEALESALKCEGKAAVQIPYLSEIDPTWNDDNLAMWVTPEVLLFSEPYVALGVSLICVVDCLATALTWPIPYLYFCAGCQGPLFPLTGHVQNHQGGVMASSLLMHKAAMKIHRLGVGEAHYGKDAQCKGHWTEWPLFNRQEYKSELVYPTANTGKDARNQCCQPFGRSTMGWSEPRPAPPHNEYPKDGEDWVYQIFRKRDCCAIVKDC